MEVACKCLSKPTPEHPGLPLSHFTLPAKQAKIFAPNSSTSRLIPAHDSSEDEADDDEGQGGEANTERTQDDVVATFEASVAVWNNRTTRLVIKSSEINDKGEEEALFLMLAFIYLEQRRREE